MSASRSASFLCLVLLLAYVPWARSGENYEASSAQIAAVRALKTALTSGDFESAQSFYHSSAVMLSALNLGPVRGKGAIIEAQRTAQVRHKPLYFYLRQPKALVIDSQSVLVATNYEQGESIDGRVSESSGKALYLLVRDAGRWLIAADLSVPNINGGSYGPLGTAASSAESFGTFPLRQLNLNQVDEETKGKISGAKQEMIGVADQIDAAWTSGDVVKLESLSNSGGAFSIGDFGAFYLASEDLHQHFLDFYKTAKVQFLKPVRYVAEEFGTTGVVAFQFDSQLEVSGQQIHSPGQSAYILVRSSKGLVMAGCAESNVVIRELGDPYQ